MDHQRIDLKDEQKMVRDEMKHEDGLINGRVGWFMTAQAFLFAAYISSHSPNNALLETAKLLLPITGLLIASLTFVGVLAAINSFNHWNIRLQNLYDRPGIPVFPQINRPAWSVGFGFLGPIVLPVFFGSVWVYFLGHKWCYVVLVNAVALPVALLLIFGPASQSRPTPIDAAHAQRTQDGVATPSDHGRAS